MTEGPPNSLACLIFFGPRAKKFVFTGQKNRRGVPQITTPTFPFWEVLDPKGMWCKWGLRCLCKIAKGGEGIIHQKVQLLHIRARLSLLLRRFVFRIAEASAKRVTGDEPQGTMGRVQTAGEARCLLPAFLCAHIFIERETSRHEAARLVLILRTIARHVVPCSWSLGGDSSNIREALYSLQIKGFFFLIAKRRISQCFKRSLFDLYHTNREKKTDPLTAANFLGCWLFSLWKRKLKSV